MLPFLLGSCSVKNSAGPTDPHGGAQFVVINSATMEWKAADKRASDRSQGAILPAFVDRNCG